MKTSLRTRNCPALNFLTDSPSNNHKELQLSWSLPQSGSIYTAIMIITWRPNISMDFYSTSLVRNRQKRRRQRKRQQKKILKMSFTREMNVKNQKPLICRASAHLSKCTEHKYTQINSTVPFKQSLNIYAQSIVSYQVLFIVEVESKVFWVMRFHG